MHKLLAQLDSSDRDTITAGKQPHWTAPMLSTLTEDYFSDPQWLFERKLDGERALAFISGSDTRLMSRNRQRLNATYPELIDALEKQEPAMIVDGEIVAFTGNQTSFSRLQKRMKINSAKKARTSHINVFYYVFDILFLAGYDLTGLSLRTRKALLKKALRFAEPMRYTPHRNKQGEAFHREACKKGWEGIIAKDATSAYVHGRSKKWLKFKCAYQQELVIGGFTEPHGARHGFGALLVGYYENDDLHFAGKVGTGFDEQTLEELGNQLKQYETDDCPFEETRQATKQGVHWVRPRLVAEIGFTEWTKDGYLRHPRYLGLRDDKQARDVVRETPQAV